MTTGYPGYLSSNTCWTPWHGGTNLYISQLEAHMRLLPVTLGRFCLRVVQSRLCSQAMQGHDSSCGSPSSLSIDAFPIKTKTSGLQNGATSSISLIFCIKNILRVGFVVFFRSPKPPVDFNMLVRASKGSSKGVGRSLTAIKWMSANIRSFQESVVV